MVPQKFSTKTEVQANSRRAASLVVLLMMVTSSVPANALPALRHRMEVLRTRLLSNYSGHFAPFSVANEPVDVSVGFSLLAILDLNAAKQVLSTLIYLVVIWQDPDLAWDPTKVDSPGEAVDYIQVNVDDIWTPKLFLVNRPDGHQVIDHYDTINVYNTGYCDAHLPTKLETTCQVDVTRYPFDTQVCQVIITPLYGTNLNVSVEVNNQLLDYFDVSGEWELKGVAVGISSVQKDTVQFVVIDLTLQRRFYFYLLTVLFPMVVLSVTGACGFLLPLQCGEKVSFQVAIMVSLAVFLSFINDAMPKTSSSISRLAIYVDLLLMQSCLSFLATLTVLRGHYHLEKLDQLGKERKCGNVKEPAEQGMDRGDNHSSAGGQAGWETVKCRSRQMMCFRRFVRRWYCCCCCIPPHLLDTFFFVIFTAAALGSPCIFFI